MLWRREYAVFQSLIYCRIWKVRYENCSGSLIEIGPPYPFTFRISEKLSYISKASSNIFNVKTNHTPQPEQGCILGGDITLI